MILVDTSVWVEHLRRGDEGLADLLGKGLVLVHPFVIGELALGNLTQRQTILAALADLPQSPVASHDEVLHFIERTVLYGRGIGYVDAHLLAAVRLHGSAALWTRDKRLRESAAALEVAMGGPPSPSR